MLRDILLAGGADEEQDKSAEEALKRLGPGVRISYTRDTKMIEGKMILPFIQTENGARYFGVDSIEDFVDDELAKAG